MKYTAGITMRDALEEDIARILEIERTSFSLPWTHGSLLSEIYNEDSFFAVALEKDRITGFVILRCAADEGELLQIAVDEKARRKGVASTLMDEALAWGRQNGVASIYLEVRKSNKAAIELYSKYGFASEGDRKNYYAGPVEDAAVMKLAL